MDVTLLSPSSVRLKSKNGTIILNPTSDIAKTEASAIISSGNVSGYSDSKVEDSKITVKATGEYEINGIKISASSLNNKLIAQLDLDGVRVLLANGASLDKIQDQGAPVVLLEAEGEFDYSLVSKLDPHVVLIYGANKNEAKKAMGKEDAPIVSKYSVTQDKLPEELQVFVLQ